MMTRTDSRTKLIWGKVSTTLKLPRRKLSNSTFRKSDGILAGHATTPDPQNACTFFARVPLELRVIIVDLVLGQHVLHIADDSVIVRRKGKRRPLAHLQCPLDRAGEDCQARLLNPMEQYRDYEHVKVDLLSLMQTCRLMYLEASERLYCSNIFDFGGSVYTRMRICLFSTLVPPQQLAMIRSIRFSCRCLYKPGRSSALVLIAKDPEWTRLWHMFAALYTGLRYVHVDLLGGGGQQISVEMEQAILGPLSQLGPIPDFKASITWQRPHPATRPGLAGTLVVDSETLAEDHAALQMVTSEPLVYV